MITQDHQKYDLCDSFYSGLRAEIKVLIASVPDLCILFTFIHFSLFFYLLFCPPGLNW